MALKTDYRWYCSLDDVKGELGVSGTGEDEKLKGWIEQASRFIERQTGGGGAARVYIPVTATRYFDVPTVGQQNLILHDDLLSVTQLSDDQGAIASSYYFLYPLNSKPKLEVQLLRSSRFWHFQDTRQKAISIEGIWGYTDEYEDTEATVAVQVADATVKTVSVSDARLIEVGWCLLIDTEQLFVRSEDGQVLTVWRGVNGTTAAAHAKDAVVYRYVPPGDIAVACKLLVAYWYEHRADIGISSKRLGDFSVTYQGLPIPDEVFAILDSYTRMTYPSPQTQYRGEVEWTW